MHAAKNTFPATPKPRDALPADIVGKNADGIEPDLPAEVAERCESLRPTLAEQFAP